MKKFTLRFQSVIKLVLIAILILPVFTHADASEATKSGKTGIVYECAGNGDCTFADVIGAIKHLVNFGTKAALMFSVVVIAFAGFKYMMSGGNPGERTKANKMLLSVVKGIAFIMGAWLIVTLITGALLNSDYAKDVLLK